jgi:hypothetical protein
VPSVSLCVGFFSGLLEVTDESEIAPLTAYRRIVIDVRA